MFGFYSEVRFNYPKRNDFVQNINSIMKNLLFALILFSFTNCSTPCYNENCWWEIYPPLGSTLHTTPLYKIPYDCNKSTEEQKDELAEEYVTNQGLTLLLSPVCP